MKEITADTIAACEMKHLMHADGKDRYGRFVVNISRVVEHPRLQCSAKQWMRRGKPVQVTWSLDGEEIGTLENALAAYNALPLPPVGPYERGALSAIPDEWEVHDDAPPPVVVTLMNMALVEKRREAGHTEYRRTDLGRQVLADGK